MLGVSPEVAAADACRIEHDISAETFECLKRHVRQYTQDKPLLTPFRRARDWSAPARRFVCF